MPIIILFDLLCTDISFKDIVLNSMMEEESFKIKYQPFAIPIFRSVIVFITQQMHTNVMVTNIYLLLHLIVFQRRVIVLSTFVYTGDEGNIDYFSPRGKKYCPMRSGGQYFCHNGADIMNLPENTVNICLVI